MGIYYNFSKLKELQMRRESNALEGLAGITVDKCPMVLGERKSSWSTEKAVLTHGGCCAGPRVDGGRSVTQGHQQ